MRTLIAEDSDIIRTSVRQALTEAGLAVDAVADGRQALIFAQTTNYDAIILDIGLPQLDGLTVLSTLRAKNITTPVLLLTARDSVDDRVIGLRTGADDYLIKPFALAELIARVRALIRRGCAGPHTSPAGGTNLTAHIRIGPLLIDTSRRTASVAATPTAYLPVDLTPREFALLECLALQAAQPVSRARLEEHLYSDHSAVQSNAVDATVYNLRVKLRAAGLPNLIHTRRGVGYLLRIEP